MQPNLNLRVGHIPYLNCVPFFHHLASCGFSGSIISGVPSALNKMLQRGEIDVSPSSSFEFVLNSQDYLLLPGHSISSTGPVRSVLLFSPRPLEELQRYKIAVTGDSATSINLLRVLLLEYVGLSTVEDFVPEGAVENQIANHQPALLIGDRAMKQAENLPPGMICFDLGALWHDWTGLPFVFALWILRRDSARKQTEAVNALLTQLDCSIQQAFANLPRLAIQSGATEDQIDKWVNYWQTIDYGLTKQHQQGLDLFVKLCQKHQLLKTSPQIKFFSSE